MKSFDDMDAFLEFLAARAHEVARAQEPALRKGANIIAEEARAEIGTYQDQAGSSPAWAELAEATKRQRAAQGWTENDPLLRSGELRESIEVSVEGNEAAIGSNSPIAAFLEFGTSRIPPRSFLGGAAFRKGEAAAQAIGKTMAHALAGLPEPD